MSGSEAPVLLAHVDTAPSEEADCDPAGAWSPDGDWIAYASRIGAAGQGTGTAVHLVRPDGSGDHVLPLPDGWNTSPAWSPDGRTLLVRNEACVGASTAYCRQWTDVEAHLLVVPIDGTPARQVGPSSTDRWLRNFAWSPDGRMIVTAVEGGATGEIGTALIDVETNTWRIVGEGVMTPGPYAWQPVPTTVPVKTAPSPAPVPTPSLDLTIRGTVTDRQGMPVAHVSVSTEGTDHLLARTAVDGSFRIQLTAPGSYRLKLGPIPGRLDHPVYLGPAGWTMNPNPGDGSHWQWAGPAEVNLVLPDATPVSGTFLDADGAPYQDALVTATAPDTAPTSGGGSLQVASTRTDGQGRFSLLVMPGTWAVEVDGGIYSGDVDEVSVGSEPIGGIVLQRTRAQ